MSKNILFGLGVVVIAVVAVGLFAGLGAPAGVEEAEAHEATVYREATCGCCSQYVAYLKRQGFEVKDEVVSNIGQIKEQYGIPAEMQSCHTAVVDGKIVEGHMPIEAIEKMLSERPDIRGIALPGMPSGSPGMPGAKIGMFEIHSLMQDSSQGSMMFMQF